MGWWHKTCHQPTIHSPPSTHSPARSQTADQRHRRRPARHHQVRAWWQSVQWVLGQPLPRHPYHSRGRYLGFLCNQYQINLLWSLHIITGNHILPRHRHYTLSYLMRCRCPLMSLRRSCVTTSMMSWPWRLRPLKLHAQQLTRRNPNHLTTARATRRWCFDGWGGSIRVTNSLMKPSIKKKKKNIFQFNLWWFWGLVPGFKHFRTGSLCSQFPLRFRLMFTWKLLNSSRQCIPKWIPKWTFTKPSSR